MLPKRTLLQVQTRKRSQGSTDQSADSGRSMKPTGSTKPISTGSRHSTQATAARRPRSRIGRASLELARAVALPTKRRRRCARCSSHSKAITSASSTVASCAAAMRLSIDSQAL